jgi:hypothetical protein
MLAIGFGTAIIPLLWFWDLGSRSPEQNAGRALVVLACLVIAATCAIGAADTPVRRQTRHRIARLRR